ncbi:hypothetical protein GWK47_026634 [Chionoecetes opilio]|uniref:Uncharacterized protein n=1 Tax=Chionoecetes opilio TaxID=41210 RepID=A0A8J8WEG9_CHIOP|nr:hypothetical protein GWK47_026634 [Chionoecetes opilio]
MPLLQRVSSAVGSTTPRGACPHGGNCEITQLTRHLLRTMPTPEMPQKLVCAPRASATPAPSQGDETTQNSTEAGPPSSDSTLHRLRLYQHPQTDRELLRMPAASPTDLCGPHASPSNALPIWNCNACLHPAPLADPVDNPLPAHEPAPADLAQAWPSSSDACGGTLTHFRAENNTG